MILRGIWLINQERQRQQRDEGYTQEHDRHHENDELSRAAVCYALPDNRRVTKSRRVGHAIGSHEDRGDRYVLVPEDWPWEPDYWKPSPDDRVKELVKAGALIAAEIDRLLEEQR